MIARKNLPSFFLSLLLILGLNPTQPTFAAPKAITVKGINKFGDSAGAEFLAASAKALFTVKNINTATSDIEVQARDHAGTSLWVKTIDSGLDEAASAIAIDSQGNLWLAGNSAAAIPVETATATNSGLNPDGVVIEQPAPLRPDMRQLTLWKINASGEVSEKFSFLQNEISLVDAISVSATGLSLILTRDTGSSIISVNLKGVFGKELKIGTSKTKLNTIVRSSDGSVNIFGSSTETLAGKKLVGREDGVLIKISKAGSIASVVRSSAPKAIRSWNSATSSLVLTGTVKSANVTETAITKFTSAFAPTWTTRISSTGPALAVSGLASSTYVALEPATAVKGISNFRASKNQNLLIQFDSKGKIISAYSAVDLTGVKAITFSQDGGIYLLTESTIFKVGGAK